MGKTIIITGGSSGIGAAAARALAREDHKLIITGRSAATKQIARETGADHYIVDFERFAEVRAFAAAVLQRYERIDALVNNAGTVFSSRRVTEDGHEATYQVNHLAGFLLTLLLRERLESSRGIVINTASAAHRAGRLDFDDLEGERDFNPLRAYGTSKLMNILHAMEINRQFKGVNAVSFHPGAVATAWAREAKGVIRWIYETAPGRLFLLSVDKGADTLLWLLRGTAGEDWQPGEFYEKRKPARKSPQVTDEAARKLWVESTRAVR